MKERLVSLDAFRGLTVASMLLVNDPGSWGAIYPPLRHAAWHGWTPTDLVFPFFLFITGITCDLSLAGRTDALPKVLQRAAILFLLGLLLNGFPFYPIAEHLLTLRIPGVLQRIALCYLAGGLLTRYGGLRSQVVVLAVLLLGYWALLMAVPVPGSGATGIAAIAEQAGTLAAWADRGLFDWGGWGNHLWGQSRSWDPEGALSTLPALGTMILGLLAGRWLRAEPELQRRILGMAGAGVVLTLLGLVWDLWFPINKNLWTSSYVLFTGGLAALLLAGFMTLIEQHRSRWWTPPLLAFGINPILAYVGSELMAIVIYELITLPHAGQPIALQEWFYDTALASWLPDRLASLAFALLFVALWYVILRHLQRRGIILKV